MKIKKLILQNFRQFRDLEIDFSITKDKNVNIILAENSTGKTTLMQSIKYRSFLWYRFLVPSIKEQIISLSHNLYDVIIKRFNRSVLLFFKIILYL